MNFNDPSGLDYYEDENGIMKWFDEDPGGNWKKLTGQERVVNNVGPEYRAAGAQVGDTVRYGAKRGDITVTARAGSAATTGTAVQTTENEVATTTATGAASAQGSASGASSVGDSGGSGNNGMLSLCAPGLECLPNNDPIIIDLDYSQVEDSKVVSGTIMMAEACGTVFAPCAIAAAIGSGGQGNWSVAGRNLLNVIPGLAFIRKADKAVDAAHVVYQGINPATKAVEYVGITMRNPVIRWAEQRLDPTKAHLDFELVKGAAGLTKIQARVWEQTLINKYGLGKNGGQLLNKINSVSKKYWAQYGITP